MSPAIAGGLVMLAVLGVVFLLASYPGRADGWAARLGRGGLVAVLLAFGAAMLGVSIVLLPDATVVGTALLVGALVLLAIATLAALRGRPNRPRRPASSSDDRAHDSDPTDERGP